MDKKGDDAENDGGGEELCDSDRVEDERRVEGWLFG